MVRVPFIFLRVYWSAFPAWLSSSGSPAVLRCPTIRLICNCGLHCGPHALGSLTGHRLGKAYGQYRSIIRELCSLENIQTETKKYWSGSPAFCNSLRRRQFPQFLWSRLITWKQRGFPKILEITDVPFLVNSHGLIA